MMEDLTRGEPAVESDRNPEGTRRSLMETLVAVDLRDCCGSMTSHIVSNGKPIPMRGTDPVIYTNWLFL
jgi:hypothetical protein